MSLGGRVGGGGVVVVDNISWLGGGDQERDQREIRARERQEQEWSNGKLDGNGNGRFGESNQSRKLAERKPTAHARAGTPRRQYYIIILYNNEMG